MKTVTVTTVATGTINEEWTFEVPDDYEIPSDKEQAFDDLLEGDSKLVSVENLDTSDEHDREVQALTVRDETAKEKVDVQ